MNPDSFQHQTQLIMLEGFREKLKKLKTEYKKAQKKFDTLCNQLDDQLEHAKPQFIFEACSHLTMYLAEMDLIDKKIKEIAEIIDNLTLELSN
jgi:uncharacterized protein YdcH (DUF465 family)